MANKIINFQHLQSCGVGSKNYTNALVSNLAETTAAAIEEVSQEFSSYVTKAELKKALAALQLGFVATEAEMK